MENIIDLIKDNTSDLFLGGGYVSAIVGMNHQFKKGFLLESLVQEAQHYPNTESKLKDIYFFSRYNKVIVEEWLTGIINKITGSDVDGDGVMAFVEGWFVGRGYRLVVHDIEIGAMNQESLYANIENLTSHGNTHIVAVDRIPEIIGSDLNDYRDFVRSMRLFSINRGSHFIFTENINSEKSRILASADVSEIEKTIDDIAKAGHYDTGSIVRQEVDLDLTVYVNRADEPNTLIIRRGKYRSAKMVEPQTISAPFSTTHYGLDK